MEQSDISLQDKLIEFGRKNFIILALFFGGLIFLGIGLVQIMGEKTASVKFEKAAVLGEGSEEGRGGRGAVRIKVDVEGQVLKPGVYSLNADSRVQDALIAAGGLSPDANRNAINLAAKIADGQKIYVPAVGETVSASINNSIRGSTPNSGDVSGLVSVNSGSQAELEELPGIGPVTAQKIIDMRPYGSTEELLDKKAVGKATWEKIKDQISL